MWKLSGQRENAGEGRAGTQENNEDEDVDNDIQDRLERMNTRQKPGTSLVGYCHLNTFKIIIPSEISPSSTGFSSG